MKTKILIHFQICISVPTSLHSQEILDDISTSKVAIHSSAGDSDKFYLSIYLTKFKFQSTFAALRNEFTDPNNLLKYLEFVCNI